MERISSSGRVFRVPELLGLILDGLGDNELAKMARVEKLTHEASIHRLWGSSLRNLVHLAHLFPQDLFGRDEKHGRLILVRTIGESDWDRFKHYSIHVAELGFPPSSFSSDFFTCFFNKSDEVFPRLRRLSIYWPSSTIYPNSEWLTVAGKALRVLELRTLSTSPISLNLSNTIAFNSLLQHLPLRTPNITSLTLPRISPEDIHTQQIKLLVASFHFTFPALTSLEKFEWIWGAAPTEIMKAIIHHRGLRDVRLRTKRPPAETNQPCFPGLARLHLEGTTEEAVGLWLGRLASPDMLERVKLELDEDNSADLPSVVPPFILSLSQAANLTEIRIKFSKIIIWKFLEPLLSCKLVTTIDLTLVDIMEDFDDGTLKRLAASWLMLEAISIWALQGRPKVTLRGLRPLVVCCPNLHSINFDVLLCDDGASLSDDAPLLDHPEVNLTRDYQMGLCCSNAEENTIPEDYLSSRRIAQLIRGVWPALRPSDVTLRPWDEDQSAEDALQERLTCTMDFLKEMDLRDMVARRDNKNKRLLEKASDQLSKAKSLFAEKTSRLAEEKARLAEEKARLAEERDRLAEERNILARKCARLEEEFMARSDASTRNDEG